MHVLLIHRICVYGHTVLCTLDGRVKAADQQSHDLLTEFCFLLQSRKTEIEHAFAAIKEVRTIHETLKSNLNTFLMEVLSSRIHGSPRVMLDVKETRDFTQYTSIASSKLRKSLVLKEAEERKTMQGARATSVAAAADDSQQVEELLRVIGSRRH